MEEHHPTNNPNTTCTATTTVTSAAVVSTNTVNSILHQILFVDCPPNANNTNALPHTQMNAAASAATAYADTVAPSSPSRTRASSTTNTVTKVARSGYNQEDGSSLASSTIASSHHYANHHKYKLNNNVIDARAARSLGHLGLVSLCESALALQQDKSSGVPFQVMSPTASPALRTRANSRGLDDGVSEFSFQSEMHLPNSTTNTNAGIGSSIHGNQARELSHSLVLDDEDEDEEDALKYRTKSLSLDGEDDDEMVGVSEGVVEGLPPLPPSPSQAPKLLLHHNKIQMQMYGSDYARLLHTNALRYKNRSNAKANNHALPPMRTQHKLPRSVRPPKPKATLTLRQRLTLSSAKTSSFSSSNSVSTGGMEMSEALMSGPVTDLIATLSSESPPGNNNYYKVPSTVSLPITLWMRKESNWNKALTRPLVTSITVIHPDKNEFVPPGYCVVRRINPEITKCVQTTHPADFGTDGGRLYICYRRSREGNPLTDIQFLHPSKYERIWEHYTVLENSMFNYSAAVHNGAYICYRQRLAHIECLRPGPLVYLANSSSTAAGYYTTGGGVVGGNIGTVHPLQRGRHPMFSAASVQQRIGIMNRLNEVPVTTGYSPATYDLNSNDLNLNARFDSYSSVSTSSQQSLTSSRSNTSLSCYSYATPNGTFLDRLPLPLDSNMNPYEMNYTQPLVAILTTLYTQHGQSAFLALEGLVKLLTDTDYFNSDLHVHSNDKNDYPITALDISIISVCEVCTQAKVVQFSLVLDFLGEVIRVTKGRLHTRTLGYLARCLIYLIHFEGSVSVSGNRDPIDSTNDDDDDADRLQETTHTISRGTNNTLQRVLRIFQDWIRCVLSQCKDERKTSQSKGVDVETNNTTELSNIGMVREIIEELVVNVTQKVDVAWHTQLILQQIQRSGGSEVFWHDLTNTTGASLFQNESHSHLIAFSLLAYLCKIAGNVSGNTSSSSNSNPAHIQTKIHTLDLIYYFVREFTRSVPDNQVDHSLTLSEHDSILRYTLRRLLPQLLFRLLPLALKSEQQNTRIYARCVKLIVTVGKCGPLLNYDMGMEVYVLQERYLLGVMELHLIDAHQAGSVSSNTQENSHVPLLEHRLIALTHTHKLLTSAPTPNNNASILHLFHNPNAMLTMTSFTSKSSFYVRLLGTLRQLTNHCTSLLSQLVGSDNSGLHAENYEENIRLLSSGRKDLAVGLEEQIWCVQSQALYLVRHIVLGLFQAVHSAYQTQGYYVGSLNGSGQFSVDGSIAIGSLWSYSTYNSRSTEGVELDHQSGSSSSETEEEIHESEMEPTVSADFNPSTDPDNQTMSPIGAVLDVEESEQAQRHPLLTEFYSAPNMHKSLIKLLENGLINSLDPMTIATFLRLHLQFLNPEYLGDFLSLPGDDDYKSKNAVSSDNKEIQVTQLDTDTIRYKYIRTISFEGMNLDNAMRHFLTAAGFRLPGEAQKIDRIISTFAQCYWADNQGDILRCPFQDEDMVYLVAFAVIMLNTDLHRANIPSSGSKKSGGLKKMTKQQFIHNLRGVNKDKQHQQHQMQLEALSDTYMASIYDSIASMPIELQYPSKNESADQKDKNSTVESIIEGIPAAQELLRALSLHDQTPPVPPHSNILDNLRHVFQNTWHTYCDVIAITIDAPMSDSQCWLSALDKLRYAFCSAALLQLEVPRRRFATQLGRVMFLLEQSGATSEDARTRRRRTVHFYASDQGYTNTEWHKKLELSSESHKTAFEASMEVTQVIRDLKKSLELDTRRTRELKRATRRIAGGNYLLQDVGKRRKFIMEGNLIKQGPSGKLVKRRLFLFSDRLLYTSRSNDDSKSWKINGDLLLTTTKVSDCDTRGVASSSNNNASPNPSETQKAGKHVFRIDHPNKSFLLFAQNAEDKKLWLTTIQDTIAKCFRHHMS